MGVRGNTSAFKTMVEESDFWHHQEHVTALQSRLAEHSVSAGEYASRLYDHDMPTKLVAIPFVDRSSTPDEDKAYVRIVLPDPVPDVLSERDAKMWAMRLLRAAGLANKELPRRDREFSDRHARDPRPDTEA